MNEDNKEEEILTDDRNRSRSKTQSPILQLQQKLEEIKQIKIDDTNERTQELFVNTLFEFVKSLANNVDDYIIKDIKATKDIQEDDHIQLQNFQLLYADALQTISKQEYQLNQAHLQCHSMAMKLIEHDKKHQINAANCSDDDQKEEINIHNIGNTTKVDEIFTEEFNEKSDDDNNQMCVDMDSYDIESDCSMSSSNSEDYKLISNNVTFKPIDEYEPIAFKKYVCLNEYICDEYDGLQSDWESNDNNEYPLEYDNESENEDEDECIELVNTLGIWRKKFDELERENEMLRNDNIHNLKMINDIWEKYEKKCIEYEKLKRKLTNNKQ